MEFYSLLTLKNKRKEKKTKTNKNKNKNKNINKNKSWNSKAIPTKRVLSSNTSDRQNMLEFQVVMSIKKSGIPAPSIGGIACTMKNKKNK